MTGLVISLFLPLMTGSLWLNRFWRNGHWSAILGYGYLLGILITTAVMQTWNALGYTLSFMPLAIILLLLSLPAIRPHRFSAPPSKKQSGHTDDLWSHVAFWTLFVLLISNYLGIFFEILWRPLYPWDAWMNWAPKARVWFETGKLLPWVTPGDWLHGTPGETPFYTLGNPEASRYPPLVPLVQTWTALGLGGWRDDLINIPWIFCALALGLGFYGQARNLQAPPLASMTAVFLLLSLPMINVHTALAGYADLWLSAFFGLSAIAFIAWSINRQPLQLALAVIFAVGCVQTKQPGIFWALLLFPAWLFQRAPRISILGGIMVLILGGLLFWPTGGISIDLPGIGKLAINGERVVIPGIGYMAIEYHAVWDSILKQYFTQGSWQLFFWVFPLVIPYAIHRRQFRAELLPATILVTESLLFLYLSFFFTPHYREAVDGTTLNRATLHAIPLLFFYALLLLTRKPRFPADES